MKRNLHDVFEAALPAALVATLAGIFFFGIDYLLAISIEGFAESLGVLPPGWAGTHAGAIRIAVALTTLVVMGFIAWWTYRMARESVRHGDTQH